MRWLLSFIVLTMLAMPAWSQTGFVEGSGKLILVDRNKLSKEDRDYEEKNVPKLKEDKKYRESTLYTIPYSGWDTGTVTTPSMYNNTPGSDPGFNHSCVVENDVGQGSGTYLGNGWVLTAAHVLDGQTGMYDTYFQGDNTGYSWDGGTIYGMYQVINNVVYPTDMALYRLAQNERPNMPGVSLSYGYPGIDTEVTIMGAGIERDAKLTNPNGWNLGNPGGTLRWGRNLVTDNDGFDYLAGRVCQYFTTVYDQTSSLGNDESATSHGDSGGGLFTYDSGVWQMVGIVQGGSNGSDTAMFGDEDYFVKTSAYRAQICAIVNTFDASGTYNNPSVSMGGYSNYGGVKLVGNTTLTMANDTTWDGARTNAFATNGHALTLNASGHTVTMTGAISGSGSLTASGGTIILSATPTYSGATTVNANTTLAASSFGQTSGITVSNYATLWLSNSGDYTLPPVTLNGAYSAIYKANGGYLEISSITGSGPIIVLGGSVRLPGSYSGYIDLSATSGYNSTLAVSTSSDVTMSKVQGSLNSANHPYIDKYGEGTLTISDVASLPATEFNIHSINWAYHYADKIYTAGPVSGVAHIEDDLGELETYVASNATANLRLDGAGVYRKTGAGELTIDGTLPAGFSTPASYTGTIKVDGGKLILNRAMGSGTITAQVADYASLKVNFAPASSIYLSNAYNSTTEFNLPSSSDVAVVYPGGGDYTLTKGVVEMKGEGVSRYNYPKSYYVGSQGTLKFAGEVSGSLTRPVSGPGAMYISNNTYQQFTLQVDLASYTGTLTIPDGTVLVKSNFGGSINLSGPNACVAADSSYDAVWGGGLSGSGTLYDYGAGNLTINGNNNSFTGVVNWGGGNLKVVSPFAGMTNNMYLPTGGTFEAANTANFSTYYTMSGPGNFVKSGAGTLTVWGVDSHQGTTTINGGRLTYLYGTQPNSSSTWTVNSGGTLQLAYSDADHTFSSSTRVVYGSGTWEYATGASKILTLSGTQSNFTGNFSVCSGSVLLDTGTLNSVTKVSTALGGLFKMQGGTHTIPRFEGNGNVTATGSGVTVTNSWVSANILTVSAGAKWNLQSGGGVIYNEPSGWATLNAYVQTGYNSGAWNGVGLNSSSAAASSGANNLMSLKGSDILTTAYNCYKGQLINSTDVVIAYGWLGDVDLDGDVDTTDRDAMDDHYGTAWSLGDFNHNGTCDVNDFNMISSWSRSDTDYGFSYDDAIIGGGGEEFSSTGTNLQPVPEPATWLLLGMSALLFPLIRRK